jgi:hypothetical protein
MRVLIEKSERTLRLMENGCERMRARVALGSAPVGPKCREGDGRTPEGVYQICLAKENGKYGRSLALSYPNAEDARRAYAEGVIDRRTLSAIRAAAAEAWPVRGARRWAAKFTCTRAARTRTGRGAAWRWRPRTWRGCSPCATVSRKWRYGRDERRELFPWHGITTRGP